jgi:putative ABC transport system substrate-binding protein
MVRNSKEISPQLTRVTVLYNPKTAPYADLLLRSITEAAPSFAVEANGTPVHDADEAKRSIDAFAQQPNVGLRIQVEILPASPILNSASARNGLRC